MLRLARGGHRPGEAAAERGAAALPLLAAERRELLGERGEHRVEAAHRLVEDPDLLLVEVREEGLLPGLDHEVDLDRPRLAEAVEPADALLEHERRLGEVGADEVVRELEVPPLAAGLAGEEDHGAVGVAEARHQPVPRLDGGRVVVEQRLEPRARDATLQLAQRGDVVAEDEDLLPVAGEPGAQLHERRALAALGDVGAPQHAGGEGADLHAPVADEAGGEAVAVGEVREERGAVGERLRAREEVVARGELGERRERVRDRAAGEERAGDLGVGLVLLEAGEELVERGGGDRLDQGEEAEVLARVEPHRRRGEEQDPEGRPADRRDRVVEGVVGEVVGLVHDDEVEGERRGRGGERRVVAERLERDDGVRRAGERRLRAAERRDALRGEQREERVELVEQLREPLEGEVLGDDDDDALGDPELAHAGEDEPRLDRLPEPDLVGEDEARHAIRQDAPRGAHLVREHVHARGEERAERVRAAERLEAHDAGAERERGRRAGVAGGELVERPARPLLDRRVGGDLDQRRIAPRDDGEPVAPGEAHGEPPALLRHLHDHPHAPASLGAVHHLHAGRPRHRAPPYHRHPGRSSTPFPGEDGRLSPPGPPRRVR